VTSPAHAAGAVDVTITTPAGTSATSSSDLFTYVASTGVPTVTGVSPTSGPSTGGTLVTITGSNFEPLTVGTAKVLSTTPIVDFGPSNPSPTVNVLSPTELTAISPPGNGTVDITVTNTVGTSTTSSADHFTYTSVVRACTAKDVIVHLDRGDVTVQVSADDIHVHHGKIIVHVDKDDIDVHVSPKDISFKEGCNPKDVHVHVDADDIHVQLDSNDFHIQGNVITVQPQLDDISVHVTGDDVSH
jgi:hypothetical protein